MDTIMDSLSVILIGLGITIHMFSDFFYKKKLEERVSRIEKSLNNLYLGAGKDRKTLLSIGDE